MWLVDLKAEAHNFVLAAALESLKRDALLMKAKALFQLEHHDDALTEFETLISDMLQRQAGHIGSIGTCHLFLSSRRHFHCFMCSGMDLQGSVSREARRLVRCVHIFEHNSVEVRHQSSYSCSCRCTLPMLDRVPVD